jgi:hypothetical protein
MTTNRSGKKGIALIIVLGLLALLVMTGVAFSIFMRTERQAAGSFLHDARGRLLLQAASARALEELDDQMELSFYPAWLALSSTSTGVTAKVSISTNQIWARHVPDYFLNDPYFNNVVKTNVSWLATTNGRVGFLIFNASGLLDVNKAGGAERSFGSDPAEIQVSVLPEVGDAAKLMEKTDYESVAEMKLAGLSYGLKGDTHLLTYSRFSTNRMTPPPFDLGALTEANFAAKRAKIKEILLTPTSGGEAFPEIDADQVIDALKDYIDADKVPTRLDSPCTERVPMINEINVTPGIVEWPSLMMFSIKVELDYPFVEKPATLGRYSLDYKITITPTNSPAGFPSPGSFAGSQDTEWDGERFRIVNLQLASSNSVEAFSNQTVSFHVQIDKLNVVDASGQTVDSVNNIIVTPPDYAASAPTLRILPEQIGTCAGVECIDPRYNYFYDYPNGGDWYPYAFIRENFDPGLSPEGTPETTNALAIYSFGNLVNDSHPYLHVADKPLRSVGELSFLPRGMDTYWKTLRLIDEKPIADQETLIQDPLYDYFAIYPTNSPLRGCVNPNTDASKVLESVFMNMPMDCYPGEVDQIYRSKILINATDAAVLAEAWMSDTNWPYSCKGQMTSNMTYLSAVSTIMDRMVNSLSDLEVTADHPRRLARQFRKEAGFRNLLGLLNPRQNYFIVVLFAQSSSQVLLPDNSGSITTKRSDQVGVMELWCDPLPLVSTNSGVVSTNFPKFIRRFEVLSLD